MDHNEKKMKEIPMANLKKVVSHIYKEKVSNECYEGTVIQNHSSSKCNSVSPWTSPQNECNSAPCNSLPNHRGNEPQLNSVYYFSQSQTFLKKICDKETSFIDPYSPLNKRTIRQKTASAGDIYNPGCGVSLHFSPGNNASNMTMRKKLGLLEKRYELPKAMITKPNSSHHHISLHETEKKFLSSVSDSLNAINDHERNKTTDTLLRSPWSSTVNSISKSNKTNATYVVEQLAPEVKSNLIDQYKKTDSDKKKIHLAALTSWLNYLLDENVDANINNDILGKGKKGADLYLRKLLISGDDLPAIKNLPQNNSYKCFLAENELSEMRARFRLLYESSSIPNDIATVVKSGKIAVRMDKRVYVDVGLQMELLGVFLSFHPFYLRLGLETILSTNMEMRTDFKSQLRIISFVITQNVFKDPKIKNNPKYVRGKTKYLINDQGAEALLQHFLTKICQFLFIVEKAWRDKTVSRKNRCLFVKCSSYKSIKDVVAMLSRELMTGTSNLPKTLSRLGVFLDRKQGFFEQFHYHVTNLLKDLNDGMVLGRTVEILANLQNNAVINCLRDPAGDRLRKVSNVKTVIDFAKRNGILPEDLYVDIDRIVQGNADEIISLLWRFVGKELIRNPSELADGKLFSFLWKQYYSYGASFELFEGTTVLEKIANAAEYHFGIPLMMFMQCKDIPDEKTLCLFTKIFISHIYEYYKLTSAAVKIQRAFRRYRTTLHDKNASNRLTESYEILTEDLKRSNAVITIQRYCRGWLARALYQKSKYDRFSKEREAKAVVIQKFIRGWLARKFCRKLLHAQGSKKRENAAIVIQSCIRGWLARLQYGNLKRAVSSCRRENAAVILQKYIRGWLARAFYKKFLHEEDVREQENAATVIQKHVRSWLAQRSEIQKKNILQRRQNAACVLQSYIRGWLARLQYGKLRRKISSHRRENAAIMLQKYIRGWLARVFYQRLLHEKNEMRRETAAIVIQKYVRFWLVQKFEAKNKILQKRENAACILQRYTRGWIVRKNRRMQHEVTLCENENAAAKLQESISVVECSSDKFEKKIYGYEKISSAEYFRILRELKKQHDRLRLRRQKYLQVVEDKMKFALLLRAERERRIKAAITLQAWWRGYLVRKLYAALCSQVAANHFARQEASSNEEWFERMQPIMNRVMSAMMNLNSKRLYVRYKATEVLQKFVGLSELCAQYVFNNGGLECILDSLDGCNRSVGSTEVVIPLCSILWSVLKFKIIRNRLSEQRRMDILKQCYHFILAFHSVPQVVHDLSAVLVALNGNSKQYEKAPFFIAELAKRFGKLSECDPRVTALRNLQNCLLN